MDHNRAADQDCNLSLNQQYHFKSRFLDKQEASVKIRELIFNGSIY